MTELPEQRYAEDVGPGDEFEETFTLTTEHVQRFLRDVMAEFRDGKDRTRYGLMNAVTATARRTSDPELRWRMEELGGAVAALTPDPVRPHGTRAVLPAPIEAELTTA